MSRRFETVEIDGFLLLSKNLGDLCGVPPQTLRLHLSSCLVEQHLDLLLFGVCQSPLLNCVQVRWIMFDVLQKNLAANLQMFRTARDCNLSLRECDPDRCWQVEVVKSAISTQLVPTGHVRSLLLQKLYLRVSFLNNMLMFDQAYYLFLLWVFLGPHWPVDSRFPVLVPPYSAHC